METFKFKTTKGVEYEVHTKMPPTVCKEKLDGMCDSPETTKPKIYISPGLSPRNELNTIIHEFAHAFFWGETETNVTRFSNALSRYVYSTGWRKKNVK